MPPRPSLEEQSPAVLERALSISRSRASVSLAVSKAALIGHPQHCFLPKRRSLRECTGPEVGFCVPRIGM